MKKLQFYKYASLVLLLLNLSMIAFFFITKPPAPDRGSRLQNKAVDIMQLDEQQHNTFRQLAKAHHQQMLDINAQQHSLLKPYFQSLIKTEMNSKPDTLLDQIQQLERQKLETTYQHFQEVKAMLKPAQQAGFETFMNDVLNVILLKSDKKPHAPKEF